MEDGPVIARRIVVALRLSGAHSGAAENSGARSALRVISDDALGGGIAMELRSAWSETDHCDTQKELLAVHTPFVTTEHSEAGPMSRAEYTQTLAAHVTAALRAGAAELLTVSHGAAGSGKSTSLFGSTVSRRNHIDEGPRDAALFPAVLQSLFAAGAPALSAAVSVLELRPGSQPTHGNSREEKEEEEEEEEELCDGDSCDGSDGEVPVEVVDLLSRAVDHHSPTRSFMEDFADIPAARYVRCGTAAEAITVLHEALRHSLAWRSARDAHSRSDVFGPRSTEHPIYASGSSSSSNSCGYNDNATEKGTHNNSSEDIEGDPADILYPRKGGNTHILVTMLMRAGDMSAPASVWRLWDLCGPTVWPDDETPNARMAFATHAALCQMAHRHRHRDVLQGGWWLAATPPSHVAEIIPLPSLQQQQQQRQQDPAAAMIEACLQHTSSAVFWMTTLRCDACFDEVNEDVLEAAAALNKTSSEETNGRVIAELRRRRRRENLNAAARVLELFSTPFLALMANETIVETRGAEVSSQVAEKESPEISKIDTRSSTLDDSASSAVMNRSVPMNQTKSMAAPVPHGKPPLPSASPMRQRPQIMSPRRSCERAQASEISGGASLLSPPSLADTDLPSCDSEAHNEPEEDTHEDNAQEEGEEEPEKAFSRAPSPIPLFMDEVTENSDALAVTVRRMLAPALAKMHGAAERYERIAAELHERHARFTDQLRRLVASDTLSLPELRQRLEDIIAAEIPGGEDRPHTGACRANGTAPVSPRKLHECEVTQAQATATASRAGNGSVQCKCHRMDCSESSVHGGESENREKELAQHLGAAERRIRFLEQQLLRSERTDPKQSQEEQSQHGTTRYEDMGSVFCDILQRCSDVHAAQRAATQIAQRERDTAFAELRRIQSESTATAHCVSAAPSPRPLFPECTNTVHTKAPDAAELLRRVLMRATTFTEAESDVKPYNDCTADPPPLENADSEPLRAFSNATDTMRKSALRAIQMDRRGGGFA